MNTPQHQVLFSTTGENDVLFGKEELERALRYMNKGKALGTDGLPVEIIEVVYVFIPPNPQHCLKKGYLPREWKRANIFLFNKAGKDLSNPNSYRLICFLASSAKVLGNLTY